MQSLIPYTQPQDQVVEVDLAPPRTTAVWIEQGTPLLLSVAILALLISLLGGLWALGYSQAVLAAALIIVATLASREG